MKRREWPYKLFALLLTVHTFANAEEDCCGRGVDHFWEVSASADVVDDSRITTPGFQDQHIFFSLADVALTYTKLFGCEHDGGAFIGIGYSDNIIRFRQNPNFRQTHFNNLNVDIGGFSSHFPGWLWKTDLGANFDLDAGTVSKYTLYSMTIWGRYALYPCLGVHMGMIVVTGLEKNKAWPIIGIDYNWRDTIKLSLVYPVDISAIYLFSESWSAGFAQRFFWTRHRAGQNEPVPRSLVEYRNTGTEARLTYTRSPVAYVSVHAGYAYGQDLIITDDLGCNGTHYKFDGAPYVGGDISIKF